MELWRTTLEGIAYPCYCSHSDQPIETKQPEVNTGATNSLESTGNHEDVARKSATAEYLQRVRQVLCTVKAIMLQTFEKLCSLIIINNPVETSYNNIHFESHV